MRFYSGWAWSSAGQIFSLACVEQVILAADKLGRGVV